MNTKNTPKKVWIVKLEATIEAASAAEAMRNATKGTVTVKDARPAK